MILVICFRSILLLSKKVPRYNYNNCVWELSAVDLALGNPLNDRKLPDFLPLIAKRLTIYPVLSALLILSTKNLAAHSGV